MVVVVIAAGAVAAVGFAALNGADEDDAGGSGDGREPADSATTSLPDPAPAGYRTVTAQDESFTLVVPESWTMTILQGDDRLIATQLYEGTGRLPDGAEAWVDSRQCPDCHSIAIDPTRESAAGTPTTVTIGVLTNIAPLGLDGAVELYEAAPSPAGSVNGETGRLTSPTGEMSWLDFTIPDEGVTGRHYFVVAGRDMWHVTYFDPFGASDRSLGDQIAQSLVVVFGE